jgi:hypothetical protein
MLKAKLERARERAGAWRVVNARSMGRGHPCGEPRPLTLGRSRRRACALRASRTKDAGARKAPAEKESWPDGCNATPLWDPARVASALGMEATVPSVPRDYKRTLRNPRFQWVGIPCGKLQPFLCGLWPCFTNLCPVLTRLLSGS